MGEPFCFAFANEANLRLGVVAVEVTARRVERGWLVGVGVSGGVG